MAGLVSTDFLEFNDASVVTISSGVAAVTHGYHLIAAETGTTDNLDTINITPGDPTYPLLLIQADTGDTITVKDSAGNIELNSGSDFALSGDRTLLLMYDGTNWADLGAGISGLDVSLFSWATASELTISGGAVTATASHHTIDTEADAASDDLDTISGGTARQLLLIRAAHTDRTVVVKHGTGNIYAIAGLDIALDNTEKALLLFYDGSNWLVLGDGGGAAIAVEENGVSIVATADTLDFKDLNVEDLGGNDAGIWLDIPHVYNGRLTLTSATPITTADVTGATTVYFALYAGNKVSLYDGTRWRKHTFTERSVAVPSTTSTPFDIFLYDDSGTLTLQTVDWTNDTTRATAITLQNGVYVKSGAATHRYLGTGRTTSVEGECEDSVTWRLLWNYYHRQKRKLLRVDATDNWTYSTATWRAANNSTANRVGVVVGVAEVSVVLRVQGMFSAGNASSFGLSGIDINGTTTNDAEITSYSFFAPTNAGVPHSAQLCDFPSVGYHYYQWTEYASTAATGTFYSTADSLRKSGLLGYIEG